MLVYLDQSWPVAAEDPYMTLFAVLAMALLFAMSYWLFRSWFAPAVIYTASWTLALLAVAALEPLLYGISGEAMFYYSVSAALFVFGTLLGQGMRRPVAPAQIPIDWQSEKTQTVVNGMLLVLALAAPLLAYQLVSSGNLGAVITQLRDARIDSVAANGEIGSFNLVNNLPVLGQFLVLMTVYLNRGLTRDRLRIIAASILWLLVALPSGSKLIALQLPFTLAVAFAISQRRIPWRIAGLSVLGFGCIFLAGLYYINFGNLVASGDSVPVHRLLVTMATYAYGGVIGFSKVLGLQSNFPFTQSPLRIPMYIIDAVAVMLGFDPPFPLASEHAPFLDVGPQTPCNVYSVLYAYFGAGGMVGVFGWSFVAGLLSGGVYRAAAVGKRWAFFVYPWVAYACIMSVQSEQLFNSSLVIAKLLLLLGVVSVFTIKRSRLGFFSKHRPSHLRP